MGAKKIDGGNVFLLFLSSLFYEFASEHVISKKNSEYVSRELDKNKKNLLNIPGQCLFVRIVSSVKCFG